MLNRKSEHTLAGLRNISIQKLKQFYGYSTLQTWSCGKSYKGSKILTYNSKVKGTHWKFVVFFKKNGPSSASFSFIFVFVKQELQCLQQIILKNVHPVHCAGI